MNRTPAGTQPCAQAARAEFSADAGNTWNAAMPNAECGAGLGEPYLLSRP